MSYDHRADRVFWELDQRRKEAHERAVMVFVRSLQGLDMEQLSVLNDSSPEGWEHDEIAKRIDEERIRRHDLEVISFIRRLDGQDIDSLCVLALEFSDGWRNEEITRRIIQRLPGMDQTALARLSQVSNAGLRRVHQEIEFRNAAMTTKTISPKRVQTWV